MAKARYVLVELDDEARALKLIGRLEGIQGVKIRGLFGKPTKFCDCPNNGDLNSRSVLGAKYNWRICPECGRAKRLFQTLRNLLDPEGLPAKFVNMYLLVNEPYMDPREIDPAVIERTQEQIYDAWNRGNRAAARRARRERRPRGVA